MEYIPNNVIDCLAEAGMALEKGMLIMGDITTEYPFDGNKDEKIKAWLFEYGRITTFIDIAFDYMAEAAKKIERAKEIESGKNAAKKEHNNPGDATQAIKALYWRYQNSEEYAALEPMPEVIKAKKDYEKLSDDIENGEMFTILKLEEIVNANAATNEMQGFVYGFKYAMLLAASSGSAVPVHD